MVALRFFVLLLLAGSIALPARASVFPYEGFSGGAGRNNTIDSNALSCDATEGCYTNTGKKCKDNPTELCNTQIVPAGRCTYGNSTVVGTCVWPHQAGHCNGNVKVGCLTNSQCADAGGTCLLTTDIFGAPFAATACTCQGTNAAGADFETTICGGGLSICSDGDLRRDVQGKGTGVGTFLKVGGLNSQTFPSLGPSVTGSSKPDSTVPYARENPPVNFDPQRDPGTIARGVPQGIGRIRQVRGTSATDIQPYSHPTIADPNAADSNAILLNVRKFKAQGNAQYGDWGYVSAAVAPPFNTHLVNYPCDAAVGWVVGTPIASSGPNAGKYCHQAALNGISFLWKQDLTPAQKSAYLVGGKRVCPPYCNKDFNLSTMELQELVDTGVTDPNAGIQLAIESGDDDLPGSTAGTRQAGDHDNLGVAVLVSQVFIIDNDLRCKVGGWIGTDEPNPAGFIGRCSDGATICVPGDVVNGDPLCVGQGGSCRACGGPIVPVTNPQGTPIGYNPTNIPALDLVLGKRIGGIAGAIADIRVPLFLVATSGNAASDFRDITNQGTPNVDLADMGPVNAALPFISGIGTGGTFVNGTQLNIQEPCCTTLAGVGTSVAWQQANEGTVVAGQEDKFIYDIDTVGTQVTSDWALTYDIGPGLDGIPGCIGKNSLIGNGSDACNQRLGTGVLGSKLSPTDNTGLDDITLQYQVGPVTIPASTPQFAKWRDSTPATMALLGNPAQNPPTTNSIGAFTLRDVDVLYARSADVLVRFNVTNCPLTGLTSDDAQCAALDLCAAQGGDVDGDTICSNTDKCPTVADTNQADGDGDGVGDACDNCSAFSNARVPGWTFALGGSTYLAANQWATLTGGQRDDDHDGFGNICDGDFTGSLAVTAADTGQYKLAIGCAKASDTCGVITAGVCVGTGRCARFDLNSANSTESSAGGISAADTGRYKLLIGQPVGPKCAACTGTGSVPLPCETGTAGGC